MVGAPAAADAVARARAMPGLRVGLHLVLADGVPVLPVQEIRRLVGDDGRFGSAMARDGLRFALSANVRRQLEREIRAQFDAFSATGLTLDHVNAHKHFHLHPVVLSLVLKVGRDHGMRAMRLPREAGTPWWLAPWLGLLRWRLDMAGIAHNDYVLGMARSGAMDEATLLAALATLPAGVTEIYLHPATISGAAIAPSMRGYRHADELAALLSLRVRQQLLGGGLRLGGFLDVLASADKAAAAPGGAAR